MTESQHAGLPWAPGSCLSLQRHHQIVNRSMFFTAKSRGWWLTFLQPRNVTFVIFKWLSRSYFYLFWLSFWHLRGKQSLLHKKCIETHIMSTVLCSETLHMLWKNLLSPVLGALFHWAFLPFDPPVLFLNTDRENWTLLCGVSASTSALCGKARVGPESSWI